MTNINNLEIDLRQEVIDILSGKDFGTPKFNILLQRQMRKDIDHYPYIGKRICKTCNKDYSNEGRTGCPDCDGVGYLWDEKLIVGYIYRPQYIRLSDQMGYAANVGRMKNGSNLLITPVEYKIDSGDILYEVNCNDNGGITVPVVKEKKHLVVSGKPMRLDYNKVEFYMSTIVEGT